MTLTHISHPEDTILTGDLSVFELLYDVGHIVLNICQELITSTGLIGLVSVELMY
jgi:hypothetical protein